MNRLDCRESGVDPEDPGFVNEPDTDQLGECRWADQIASQWIDRCGDRAYEIPLRIRRTWLAVNAGFIMDPSVMGLLLRGLPWK